MCILSYYRPTTRARIIAGEDVPWVINSHRPNYVRRVVLSILPWVKREELKALVEECRKKSSRGVKYELDHIIPVGGELVSGLTVPWNLEIKTRKQNRRKGNRLTPAAARGTI